MLSSSHPVTEVQAIRSASRPLRVASHLAPSVLPAYALVARRIGERLGRPTELIVAADYRRCGADLDEVCFVCSIPYLLLADAGTIAMTPLAAPVLRGRRYRGRPVYYSEVVVRAESPYRSFAELAGTAWAYNEPFSHSGFMVALHRLASAGLDASFIGEWVETGFHDDALRAVIDGRAEWAAIDSQVLQLWRRADPMVRRRLRSIEVLGPSIIQPVVASTRRLTSRERGEILAVLIDLDRDALGRAVLAGAGIRCFVPVADADYDDIRDKLGLVRSSDLLPGWWDERWEAIVSAAVSRRAPAARSAPVASSLPLPHPAPTRPRRSSPPPSPPPS
jgi:phosphonate transport system substrate-binding protein